MSNNPIVSFDGIAGSFSKYDTTLSGYVRYQVTRRNLAPYLAINKKLKVLDIGGGSGPDAVWLVSLGHKVTIVEISQEQRLYAERRFNFFLGPKERALITMVEGDLTQLTAKPGSFDLVLCHGVAKYQPNPRSFIKEVTRWARPNGIISILEKGYYGAEARAVHYLDFDQLNRLHAYQKTINQLGFEVHTFTPDALETILQMTGVTIEKWAGVGVMTDGLDIRISELDTPTLESVVEAEHTQGNNLGIRAQGQMLHFIARR